MTREPFPESACPHCGKPLAPPRGRDPQRAPPTDGDVSTRDSSAEWVSIGRFTNLAEVGYFCDVLARHQIPTNLRQHDEFSATYGSWQSIYILQVPEEFAAQAVQLTRAELEEDSVQDPAVPNSDLDVVAETDSGLRGLARSAALILVVGGLAFYAGRAATGPNDVERSSGPPLWETIEEIDLPLTTDNSPAKPRHRIRVEPKTSAVLVERDVDGDGRYEPWRAYRRGRLVVD